MNPHIGPGPQTPSVEEVAAARARFHSEYAAFQAALPSLMSSTFSGDWVVFFDGEVKHHAADRRTAHDWAVQNLGRLAGFVVAEVAAPRVHRIGGAQRRPPRSGNATQP